MKKFLLMTVLLVALFFIFTFHFLPYALADCGGCGQPPCGCIEFEVGGWAYKLCHYPDSNSTEEMYELSTTDNETDEEYYESAALDAECGGCGQDPCCKEFLSPSGWYWGCGD